MKKRNLTGFVFFGFLLLGIMAVGLTGCGDRKYLAAIKETDPQQYSISGDLQWKSCFGWNYLPIPGGEDSEKVGYFVSEESRKSRMQSGKQGIQGVMGIWQRDEKIEVYYDVLSEEDFFTLIRSRAEELEEKYPEEEVVCRINGSTGIDQFVQLDADKEHRLYLRYKDKVYVLYGEMDDEKWQNFLEEWLFTFGLKWSGSSVMKPEGTIRDEYAGYRGKGIRNMIQCGTDHMRINEEVFLFHALEEGFYLKTSSKYIEDCTEEAVICPAENYPEYDSGEGILTYFKNRYQDMYSLEAYLFGENALRAGIKKMDHVFYVVAEPEGIHGFFQWNGEAYEMYSSKGEAYLNIVNAARFYMGYDMFPFFLWKKEADGSISQSDYFTNTHFYRKDLGGGEMILVKAEMTKEVSDEMKSVNANIYQVEIYEEKENLLLQEIKVQSTVHLGDPPLMFEDFNGDGYLDIITVEWHDIGADYYIYSPSKEEFVKLELESEFPGVYYASYRAAPETRRLYGHYYFMQYCGLEVTYQWENEMDYKVIKRFLHDEVENGVRVWIARYENGKEEILSDYIYSYEEYEEREDIWGTYHEDFIWEKEVADRFTGKKYTIRYAEVFQPAEAEKNGGIYYDGRIYVYDEDTYLVSVTHSEIVSKSSDILWGDGSGEKEQAVVIHYVDGGESTFYLSGLTQPDYQPSE